MNNNKPTSSYIMKATGSILALRGKCPSVLSYTAIYCRRYIALV